MKALYLGIDPGLNGGFALISGDRIVFKFAMPSISIKTKEGKTKKEIAREVVLSHLRVFSAHATIPSPLYASIEEQIPVRNQDIRASHTLAKNYGILLMALTATQINYTEVPSDVWQLHFGIVSVKKAGGKSTKEQALEVVKRIYSNTDFRKSGRSYKAHDGMVDAALIANYCQFLIEGEENGKKSSIKKDL